MNNFSKPFLQFSISLMISVLPKIENLTKIDIYLRCYSLIARVLANRNNSIAFYTQT